MADLKNCIGSNYRDMLTMMIASKVGEAALEGILGKMAICDDGRTPAAAAGVAAAAKTGKERKEVEFWPDATYYGKDGKVITGSFSGLFKQLFGVSVLDDKVNPVLCNREGGCRALSTVENFRNRGLIVKGNGEDPPVPKGDMSSGAVDKMYATWKDHLLASKKKINIYHPEYPGIKQAVTKSETVKPVNVTAVSESSEPGFVDERF